MTPRWQRRRLANRHRRPRLPATHRSPAGPVPRPPCAPKLPAQVRPVPELSSLTALSVLLVARRPRWRCSTTTSPRSMRRPRCPSKRWSRHWLAWMQRQSVAQTIHQTSWRRTSLYPNPGCQPVVERARPTARRARVRQQRQRPIAPPARERFAAAVSFPKWRRSQWQDWRTPPAPVSTVPAARPRLPPVALAPAWPPRQPLAQALAPSQQRVRMPMRQLEHPDRRCRRPCRRRHGWRWRRRARLRRGRFSTTAHW